MMGLDDVARVALEMPGVTEGERHGNRSWSVDGGRKGGRTFAWERPFSKADLKRFGEEVPPEGPILAVRVADLHEKEAVLAANPGVFFTIPHFDGFPAVLIQLQKATEAAVRDVLLDGWLASAPPSLTERYRAP
jgi:hypothetical protein